METPIIDYSKEVTEERENKKKPNDSIFSRFFRHFKEIGKEVQDDVLSEEEKQKKLKARLEGLHKTSKLIITLFMPLCVIISVITALEDNGFLTGRAFHVSIPETFTWPELALSFFYTLLVCAVALMGVFTALKKREINIHEEIFEYELSHTQNKAQEDPFQNSIKTSYKYLDRYYDQTQRQAQQGFFITLFIAVFGALLIFGGVIAMYFGFIQPAYITCASGAITELISAIFFYLYNKTVTSMSRYHNKLVLSQNISFALRVADSLTEKKKDAAKLEIIKELMKDVNAQMMKSDADDTEPPKKKQSADAETPSGNE